MESYPSGFNPTARRTGSFDRFIPYRPGLHLEIAHYQLLQGFHNLAPTSPDATTTPSSLDFDDTNSINVIDDNNDREDSVAGNANRMVNRSNSSDNGMWFHLSTESRARGLEYKRRLSLALDDIQGCGSGGRILPFSSGSFRRGSDSSFNYNNSPNSPQSPSNYSSPVPQRHIHPDPDTVLYLPMRNDFYCNLLDWSARNTIAAGVDTGVYAINSGDYQLLQPTQEALQRIGVCKGYISSVRWDASGSQLALGYSRGFALVWDVDRMDVVHGALVSRHSHLGCMAWLKDTIFCGTSNGRVHRFDLREKSPVALIRLPTHRKYVCNIQLSPNESLLAFSGDDGDIHLWELRAGKLIMTIHAHQACAKALSWCPWRRNILASGGGSRDGYIRIWNVSSGALKAEVNTHMQVSNVLWSEEYKELVSSQSTPESNEIVVWAASDLIPRPLSRLTPPNGRPIYMCLSHDGTTLACAAADERLRMWKLFPKKCRQVESLSPLNLDRSIR